MTVFSLKVVISLTVPFPYRVVSQPIPCLKWVSYNDSCVCVCNLFLHSFPSETSPEHFNRVFSTCAVRKTKTPGSEWMLVVDWLIFRHGVFPAVKCNRVENAPCDVTREILLNIIHTHQIKIRQKKLLKKLIYSIGNFLCNKIPCFCHHV